MGALFLRFDIPYQFLMGFNEFFSNQLVWFSGAYFSSPEAHVFFSATAYYFLRTYDSVANCLV